MLRLLARKYELVARERRDYGWVSHVQRSRGVVQHDGGVFSLFLRADSRPVEYRQNVTALLRRSRIDDGETIAPYPEQDD